MANVFIAEETMTAIGEAIREKTGKTELILPANMPAEIKGITGDGSGESSDLVKYVTFMSENGTTELYKMPVLVGDDCKDPIAHGDIDTPTKESTNTQNFTYSGWALTSGGAANNSILKNITEDITVYVAFTASVRYYTVTFYDDDQTTVLNTMQTTYGSSLTYIPTKTNYGFVSWTPSPTNVTTDMSCYATWIEEGFGADTWDTIIARSEAGTASEYYALGDTRNETITLSDGTSKTIKLMVVGFDLMELSDGSGKKAGMTIAQVGHMNDQLGIYQMYSYSSEQNSYLNLLPEELINGVKSVKRQYGTSTVALKIWAPDFLNVFETTECEGGGLGPMFPILEGLSASQKYSLLLWNNVSVLNYEKFTYKNVTYSIRSYFTGSYSYFTECVVDTKSEYSSSIKVNTAICFCV